MSKFKAGFCYDIVTTESAEIGDTAEHGWILPGMWTFPLYDDDGHHNDVLDQAQAGDFDIDDLGEAIRFAESLGISEDCGTCFSTSDSQIRDYSTDEHWSYSMHIDGVTPSTYRRIARLLRS